MGGPLTTARLPWMKLGAWIVVAVALAALGTGIADRLSPSSLLVPGTPSARAREMLDREFGSSIPVTVLLRGPAGAIDRQGPRLVTAFRREPKVDVMSPWDSGPEARVLRPRPTAALVVAGFERPTDEAMNVVVPTAQRIVGEEVRRPLRADVGGIASIAVALQDNSLAATHRAELLVTPFLIVILLLVFRSPVAAAIPLLMGATTVLAGRGLLLLSTYVISINSLAVAMASMMGLALGVDYALLMVSRFRQERDSGAGPDLALSVASRAAGRTILYAGGTLVASMFVAVVVAPGDLLSSVAAGVIVSALFSVVLAISLMPLLLRVLSPYLERWRLPSAGRGDRLLNLASGLIARPLVAIPLIALPMLAIATPASALKMGPPDARQLPPSDPTRQGFEALRRAIGPGWAAPITIVATAREGAISKPGRLEAISRWQDRIAREPGVAAVIGPESLREADGPLRSARRAYRTAPQRLASAQHGIEALSAGLRRAGNGVAELRAGLGSAAHGATRIAGGTGEAQAGARHLEAGLGQASAGAHRLSAGLDSALRGADRLVSGQHRLGRGAERLAAGIRRLDDTLRASLGQVQSIATRLRAWSGWIRSLRVPTEMAAARLESAVRELEAMTVGKEDPRYSQLVEAIEQASALVGAPVAAPAEGESMLPKGVSSSLAAAIVDIQEQLAHSVDSLASLPEQLDRLAAGVHQLRTGANRIARGATASERGGRELRAALRRLARGSHHLDRGVVSVHGGGRRLADGLGEISSGASRLSSRLLSGQARSGRLVKGLAKPQGPLSHYAMVLHGYRRRYDAMRARSPGAIDSGYLLLTALDGTLPLVRERIEQVVNLERGGRTVRMLVVPSSGPSAPSTVRLTHRLQDKLPRLARASDTEVGIGEGAMSLADYTEATRARTPILIISLSLVAIVMLLMVVRSLLLPWVAVALNLLTIAAAFGALKLFFALDLLTGPHYIDAISAAGVLTVMFVLSIDYEVFLLTRMRETWLQTGDHRQAIEQGLRHTAGVITGAATIMSLVFLAFASAQIASLQQFGAGLTFAVVLDATVIRLVLLPAIMRALGPWAWWLPDWIDRRLPHIDHGEAFVPAAATAAGSTALHALRMSRPSSTPSGATAGSPPSRATAGSPPFAADDTAVREFEAVSKAEHRRMLDLLVELEIASGAGDAARVLHAVDELRTIAEPHFRYEQQALFPHLVDTLGPDRVERLYAGQDDAAAALSRIEALAEPGTMGGAEAAEARRLVRAARAAVMSCDAACDAVEHQPSELAERVLAARERILGAIG